MNIKTGSSLTDSTPIRRNTLYLAERDMQKEYGQSSVLLLLYGGVLSLPL